MQPGEIWYVDFPFEDDPNQSKKRPCIVIDVEKLEVLAIKVTTHKPRDEFDIPILNWRQYLPEESYARVSQSVSISKKSFLKKLAQLSEKEFKEIVKAFIEFKNKTS